MFEILSHKYFWGPNQYAPTKCVLATVIYSDLSSPEFISNAVETSERLAREYQYRGKLAVLERPDDCLEFLSESILFLLNYCRGELEFSSVAVRGEFVDFVIEFHNPNLVFSALKQLFWLVSSGAYRDVQKFDHTLSQLFAACHRYHPDFQAHVLISAARERGIFHGCVGKKIYVYGMGSHSTTFFESSPLSDHEPEKGTRNKVDCKHLFSKLGLPTPDYTTAQNREELSLALDHIGFPCVIKPDIGSGGRGVTAGITTFSDAVAALDLAFEHMKDHSRDPVAVVETFVEGEEYRIEYHGGKFLACVNRQPATIVGTGEKTVESLIADYNGNRTKNLYASGFKKPVPVDSHLLQTLKIQELSLSSVLEKGRSVALRRHSNLSMGGTAHLIENIHPSIVEKGEKLADETGIYSLGVDYITKDISKPLSEGNGYFIEINRTPGVDAPIGAGMDLLEVGNAILPKDVANIPVTLLVADSLGGKLLDNLSKTFSGIYIPGQHFIKSGRKLNLKENFPYELIPKILSDSELSSLIIVSNPRFISKNGLPVQYLEQVLVNNAELSEESKLAISRLQVPVTSLVDAMLGW